MKKAKDFLSRKDGWISSTQARLIAALALLTLLASGCSRQETPKTLASRLSKADRVIVLNPIGGFTITIQDDSLRRLVRALETSTRHPEATDRVLLVQGSPRLITEQRGWRPYGSNNSTSMSVVSPTLRRLSKNLLPYHCCCDNADDR